MTPFTAVYKRFEMKIEDLAPNEVGSDGWDEMKLEYLMSALGKIELDGLYFYDKTKSLELDLTDIDEENLQFNRTLSKKEIEVLALYMVAAWYEPRINSLEHTLMYYGSKDEKWTNQKDHLKVISDTQQKYLKEARAYYSHNAGRNNPFVNGEI